MKIKKISAEAQYNTSLAAEPKPQNIHEHAAVLLEHRILVFGGLDFNLLVSEVCQPIVWAYNLYTEKWRKHEQETPTFRNTPPACFCACAVAIGLDVYMFDGRD